MDTDKKIVIRLSAVLFILAFLFVLSFLFKNSETKSMTVESAILNPKYRNIVSEIRIKIPDESKDVFDELNGYTGTDYCHEELVLKKYDSVWTGEQRFDSDLIVWPADDSTVERLLDYAVKLRKMYEKSYSVKNFELLSVTEENARIIEFYADDGRLLSKVLFGKENALTSRINIRSSAKLNVYETEDDISVYLNAKNSFYSDPYLYPLCITDFSNEQKAALLRHGNIFYTNEEKNKCNAGNLVDVVRKDFADGSGVILRIHNVEGQKENTYTVIPELIYSLTAGKKEINAFSRINYSYSISSWTYQKLIEGN